jgi:putative heme iron utilization protein
MPEAITPAVSDRICKHMNDDHADAVLTYAQVFGNTQAATAARMESIDLEGMTLAAEVEGQPVPVRIKFEAPLEDAKAAHHVLVDMLKQVKADPA